MTRGHRWYDHHLSWHNAGAGCAGAFSDSSGDYDALLTGYSFEFGSTADTFAISRTSSNTSTAQLSGGTITDTAAYNAVSSRFGVTFKFTSATDYEVFLQPLTATSTAIGSGSLTGSTPQFRRSFL